MSDQFSYEQTRKTVTTQSLDFAYHDAGSGEPLILLHGSGPGVSAWSNFANNLPVFVESGFRVIMPDLPGFGATPLTELDKVYPVYAAERILEFMDALGIESAFVIGNSMGGSVAGELAVLAPNRIRKMALMGPGGLAVSVNAPDPSEGGKRLFEFLAEPTRERMVSWVECMVANPALITTELIDERMKNALEPGAIERTLTIFGSLRIPELVAAHRPLWARAAEIETPTLIVWGREDRMLLYDQAHFAVRHLPNVELHTFSQCGHWAQIERKDAFERVVIEFLQRI